VKGPSSRMECATKTTRSTRKTRGMGQGKTVYYYYMVFAKGRLQAAGEPGDRGRPKPAATKPGGKIWAGKLLLAAAQRRLLG